MTMAVRLELMALPLIAGEEVDIGITLGSSSQNHAMWVKRRGRDWTTAMRMHPA